VCIAIEKLRGCPSTIDNPSFGDIPTLSDTPNPSDEAKYHVEIHTDETMTSTQSATSKDEPADTVRELAELYARIERIGETTEECAAELETAKNAISVAQDRLFDAEVDRVREELTDGSKE
jgi:uncharacterized metal-binding protein YceD (DUF177 family)